MTRKHALIGSGVFLTLAVCAVGMNWSLAYVPTFYRQALDERTDPKIRKKRAKKFVQNTLHLVQDINHADEWSQEFTEKQVNSWLAEDLPRLPPQYSIWVPKTIREPRIQFADGIVHIAFRYTTEQWDTIISCELRPWITAPNRLAIEFSGAQAGLVPVPMDDVLEETGRLLTKEGWKIEWTQSGGNDVIIVDLGVEKSDQPVLESLELQNGSLSLFGRGPSDGGNEIAELFIPPSETENRRN